MAAPIICDELNCSNPAERRGFCDKHYRRRLKGGLLERVHLEGRASAWLDDHGRYNLDDCLPWPFERSGNGYGRLTLNGRKVSAHRAMCAMVNGPPPTAKHVAAHSCGRGRDGCVNPRHLRWATAKENHDDMVEHGTVVFAKPQVLSDDDVRAIRSLKGKMSQKAVGDRFGVHHGTVSRIQALKHRSAVK